MTNPLDSFLRRHNVDVGHSFAICSFLSATFQLFAAVGDALVGKININFGIPIGLVIGMGLWQHKGWARTLMLVVTWLTSLFLGGLIVLVMLGVRGNIALTFGTTVISHPSPTQAMVFGVIMCPICVFVLGVWHSNKAREEFAVPNRSLDPTPAPGMPPAGQESRQG